MTSEILDFSKEGITFLLPTNDVLNNSDVDLQWQKRLDLVKDTIETRLDIFKQRKDKNTQYINDQLTKLDNKEKEYVKKYQETEKMNAECKLELKHIEYSFFDVRSKLAIEKELNKQLQDKIAQLNVEKEGVKEKVTKMWKTCLTVINWYKEYLNIHIQLDKQNSKICTVSFGPNQKTSDDQTFNNVNPYIKFEILEENKFKLIDMHPPIQCEKENIGKTHTQYQITSFLYSVRRAFTNGNFMQK